MCAPNSRAAVILGETYFFRSNSNAAILMILKETGASVTDLEIIACAGSAGLLGLSWGAHKDYVHKITDSLQRASMNVEVVKEIANYENHQP
jgi:peroxiredoxin family protein